MRGEVEEHHFGPEGEITLLLYLEAAYLKDDIDGIRILFTGIRDKPHAVEEARRMVAYHQLKEENASNRLRRGIKPEETPQKNGNGQPRSSPGSISNPGKRKCRRSTTARRLTKSGRIRLIRTNPTPIHNFAILKIYNTRESGVTIRENMYMTRFRNKKIRIEVKK